MGSITWCVSSVTIPRTDYDTVQGTGCILNFLKVNLKYNERSGLISPGMGLHVLPPCKMMLTKLQATQLVS